MSSENKIYKLSRRQLLKMIGVGAGATAGSAVLAACAPAARPAAPAQQPAVGATAATKQEAAPTAAPAQTSGAVKVAWWNIQTTDPLKTLWAEIQNDFMKANPNIAIESNIIENDAFKTKLAAAMQAGTPPDLFQSWGGGVLKAYIDAGLVQDITEPMKGGWGDQFKKAALDVYTFDGKTYAPPWNFGMVGFWYNKDIFKQANVEPPKTWTEFLDVVQKLKDSGTTPIALGNKDKWPGHFWWSYGAIREGGKAAFDAAFTRTGTFADAPFIEGGKRLEELIKLEPFPNGFEALVFDDQSALMGNGKAAMELMGHWAPSNQKSKSTSGQGIGDALAMFPFPMIDGGKGDASDVLGGTDAFAVGKNAPPEAIEFLKFFTSVDSQKKVSASGAALSPVTGTEDAIPDELMKDVVKRAGDAKYFQVYYDQYLPPAVGEAVKDTSQALLSGKMSAEDAAKGVEAVAAVDLAK